ncbi:L-ascorbate metabolism protein UlaG, beta-lactamase superfamily [Reichenbachiella faecimaris]|uniref:L-ascorbate metabolism protein UlaG, beta-lactamase superfamily n=1 Tax=Reichenbachiella faecimaris TaxID=692418 RepID=A0A1W2GK74_REIFA|nr:MBL fold metallo-hydrolase [Reichenbachiella faecimaris]SMD37065.1 L-ascorbate metabolism protein UlaG, beta-lactamase superfamily [Reichenbachiella faecimaris]
MNRIIFLIILLGKFIPAFAQHTINYIANEGILIQSTSKSILIDAIFDDYYKDYSSPSEQTIRQLNAKESPFQVVDLLLVTHAHLDHFNPEMVYRFLKSHSETELICPNQAIDSIAKSNRNIETLNPRLNGIISKMGWQSLFLKGVSIQTAYVRHGGQQNYKVDNQIYLIHVDGKKILHLGDSEMDPSHFSQLQMSKPPIDVALIPYWYLAYSPGIDIIKNQIKPNKLIAIHYPKVGDPKSLQKIRENFPNAVVFMEEGESVEF